MLETCTLGAIPKCRHSLSNRALRAFSLQLKCEFAHLSFRSSKPCIKDPFFWVISLPLLLVRSYSTSITITPIKTCIILTFSGQSGLSKLSSLWCVNTYMWLTAFESIKIYILISRISTIPHYWLLQWKYILMFCHVHLIGYFNFKYHWSHLYVIIYIYFYLNL